MPSQGQAAIDANVNEGVGEEDAKRSGTVMYLFSTRNERSLRNAADNFFFDRSRAILAFSGGFVAQRTPHEHGLRDGASQ